MDFNKNLIFFFSALGAFNGLFLSIYFGILVKNRNRATNFLAALLFVISLRVTKSVFLSFYPGTSSNFVSLGLTACFLIGPFIYLYVKVASKPQKKLSWYWIFHIIPVILFMVFVSIKFPYHQYKYLWWRNPPRIFGVILFTQWTLYLIATFFQGKNSFKSIFNKTSKSSTFDFWIVNIIIGGFIIWLAYNTTTYTSYIVGALSFSFTFYITLIIWFYKQRKNPLKFTEPTIKYANKKFEENKVKNIKKKLEKLFYEEEIHLNKDLKLSHVANNLELTSHELSQFLNDNLGLSFTNYINGFRIESAISQLQTNNALTLEAIGNECGFKSNSTFYTAFKKHTGKTPAQFKKSSSKISSDL